MHIHAYLVLEELRDLDFVIKVEPFLVRSFDKIHFIDHKWSYAPQWDRRQLELFPMDGK